MLRDAGSAPASRVQGAEKRTNETLDEIAGMSLGYSVTTRQTELVMQQLSRQGRVLALCG